MKRADVQIFLFVKRNISDSFVFGVHGLIMHVHEQAAISKRA